ncbi:DUF2569 domain-containing protein [Dryocola sp. BD613]|uniref:DUF2569 domain-containing protein n=1 Tax=Dryocola sp. BD613 TaxID=3133272 RepID=UPI003F501B15
MKCITCDNEALSDSDSCGECERKALSKIGGLLWVPAFGLVAGLVMYLVSITNLIQIIAPVRQNVPQIMPLIVFELAGQIVLALLALYTAVLFFSRRRRAVATYVCLLLSIVLYRITDTYIAIEHFNIGPHITNYGQIMPSILGALIWVPYFLRSVRVKRTFVR